MIKDRKVKHKCIIDNTLDFIDGLSLDDVVGYIKDVTEKYPDYFNFIFEVYYNWDHVELQVWANRYETDEEVARREKKSKQSKVAWKKRKAKIELENKLLLKKLKEKYER